MRLGSMILSVLIVASAAAARADDDRRAYAPAEPVAIESPTPAPQQPRSGAPRLHPQACQTLCRVWEFLGSIERPPDPQPVPTS